MRCLQVLVFTLVGILSFDQTGGMPFQQGGQVPVTANSECRIEAMNQDDHETFYKYCSSFEGTVNDSRKTAYFTEGETYTLNEGIILDYFGVVNKTSVSPECLHVFQPFICFHYFKFPLKDDDCTEGYAPPCNSLCEQAHEACKEDFDSIVEMGLAERKYTEHLDCVNFAKDSMCVPVIPTEPATATDEIETDAPTTQPVSTDSPTNETLDADECNCAKKVRETVTKRMILDPDYSLAAQISVLTIREEGEDEGRHVVYDVAVHKEYQISCRAPLPDGVNTTIHMETPLKCLEGDYGCRGMEVGRDRRYLVVGTTTIDGKWLLRDSKGSGGCAISEWNSKYNKMPKWASESVPSDEECAVEEHAQSENE